MLNDLVLFNFNDIALLLIMCECCLLSLILLSVSQGKKVSNQVLSFFLAAFGIQALDTLIYWCTPLKLHYFSDSSHIFFILKFALLAQGPLLFIYTKSVIYNDFKLRRNDALHFIPVAVFPLYLLIIFSSLGKEDLALGVTQYDVYFADPFFKGLLWMQNCLVAAYGGMSFWLLRAYKVRIQDNYSNIEKIDRSWLQILIGGFLALWTWNIVTQLAHYLGLGDISQLLGLASNYFGFIFINILVFYSLLHAGSGYEAQTSNNKKVEAPEQYQEAHVTTLKKAMEEDALYLDPEITLDQLAERTSLSARQVSNVINRHFNQNFFEFINFYRVEKAKILLKEQHELSVLDIMDKAGFNSKSAFNRFFKKYAEMTPTQYRKQG